MKRKEEIKTKNPPKVLPIKDLPDNIKAMIATFWEKNGMQSNTSIVVTFHDAIYTAKPMPQDLFVHECVHYVRQGSGENIELATQYVDRYLSDPKFRLEEELLAYREQYRFIYNQSNRLVAFEHAKRLASELSSALYGNIISFHAALSAIIK